MPADVVNVPRPCHRCWPLSPSSIPWHLKPRRVPAQIWPASRMGTYMRLRWDFSEAPNALRKTTKVTNSHRLLRRTFGVARMCSRARRNMTGQSTRRNLDRAWLREESNRQPDAYLGRSAWTPVHRLRANRVRKCNEHRRYSLHQRWHHDMTMWTTALTQSASGPTYTSFTEQCFRMLRVIHARRCHKLKRPRPDFASERRGPRPLHPHFEPLRD